MQKIPLEIITLEGDGFHILVNVRLLDQPFKMVVDTGASKTVLDKNTLLESGIQDHDFEKSNIISTGLGTNSMESFMLQIPEIKLSNWSIKNHVTAVLDLSTINYAYNQMHLDPVVGVLGGDILTRYGALIDYKKRTLTLNERKIKI